MAGIKDALNKAKNKAIEVGGTIGETVVETGKKVKDSKAAENVVNGIKVGADAAVKGAKIGAEKVAEGAKIGADAVAKGAKASADKVKETVDNIGADKVREDGHTVVTLNGCKMQLLIPDGYTKLKRNNAVNQFVKSVQNTEVVYQKMVDNSNNALIIWKTDKAKSMDCSDTQQIIDGIHECLADNQGLIEVKNGKTKRGYNYIYSIVKTLADEDGIPLGVRYFLRMTLNIDSEYIEINGYFEEQGMTGIRESMSTEFARRAGLVEFTENGLEGWSEDPYDPDYTKGIVKNLAEKEGIDGLFPFNPLTQAREFVLAIVNDELVIIKKDESEDDDEVKEESDSEEKVDEKEFCLGLFADECRRHTYEVNVIDDTSKSGTEKKETLDDQLRKAVDEYNATYTDLNDCGTKLFVQRQRALDLLQNVENLVNSIANHPKTFDKDFEEIKVKKEEFVGVCEYAERELEAAKQSAMGVGAGVAGGMAVASLAPSAAMWIATTFGTASTGTAISTLSGAAATNAALAWLGGGAVAASGGGMAAGEAFLALAGPVGWGIAGATLLTSIVLFSGKKMKINKEKKEEIESVLANTEKLKETTEKIRMLLEQTTSLRDNLSNQYNGAVPNFGKDFMSMPEETQMLLGTVVNNAKSLAFTLCEGV